jgi:hypothetical protein
MGHQRGFGPPNSLPAGEPTVAATIPGGMSPFAEVLRTLQDMSV